MPEDDTQQIGYLEDGIFWLTASSTVPDTAAAERDLGGGWRVVEEVWLGPTGQWVNHKDPEWAECASTEPGARRGWRLVDTAMPEIFEHGDWHANPHHVSPRASRGGV
ncbi:MAG: hypothetical protein ACR2KD_02860 [Thermoleophilaceae bacterium]